MGHRIAGDRRHPVGIPEWKVRGLRAAKGEGSAFKSGSGYRGYVTVNGKRKYFSAKTKAEAAQKRRELLNRRDDGRLIAGRVPTVGQWTTHWLDNVAKHRPTTHANNLWIIEKKVIPELGAIKLDALSQERIEQWLKDLDVKASSQRRYLAPLRRALEVAVERGRIPFNPCDRVELEALNKPNTAAFSGADRKAILEAATGWNRARWHLALKLGPRPSEALGLEWTDFDEKAGTLHFRQQLLRATGRGLYLQDLAKTAAGDRIVKLPTSLITEFVAHRRAQLAKMAELGDEWVGWEFERRPVALIFTQENGRPIDARMDRQKWDALLTSAGLAHARRYQSRHTAASHMVSDGGDVAVAAMILGHADPAFTYRVYVHPLAEREQAMTDKIELLDAPYPAPYDAVTTRNRAERESSDVNH